jgi:hypothetical protein
MQTPTGSPNPASETPGAPNDPSDGDSKSGTAWPFILSPYYLSALGVALLIVGGLNLLWPLMAAGGILTAIALARYLWTRTHR